MIELERKKGLELKATHRPYSTSVIALKAAILPPILTIIGSMSANYVPIGKVGENLVLVILAFTVFVLEWFFLFASNKVNDLEVFNEKKKRERSIEGIQKTLEDRDKLSAPLVSKLENKLEKELALLHDITSR